MSQRQTMVVRSNQRHPCIAADPGDINNRLQTRSVDGGASTREHQQHGLSMRPVDMPICLLFRKVAHAVGGGVWDNRVEPDWSNSLTRLCCRCGCVAFATEMASSKLVMETLKVRLPHPLHKPYTLILARPDALTPLQRLKIKPHNRYLNILALILLFTDARLLKKTLPTPRQSCHPLPRALASRRLRTP